MTLAPTTVTHHAIRVPARGMRPGKYVAVLVTAFRQRLLERAMLVGRIAFYCIVLMIFSRLWQAVFGAAGDAHGAAAPNRIWVDYVWYLALTEWIMLSQPSLHLDIEADDLDAEVQRLEALGAKRLAFVKERWWVLEAPTGHRFCVVRPQRGPLQAHAHVNVWSDGAATP